MVPTVVGQRQASMMPFTLEELVILSCCLRDACLGIIKLAYPETKPEVREEYIAAFRSVGVTTNTEMQQCIQTEQKRWIQLFKVYIVSLIYSKPKEINCQTAYVLHFKHRDNASDYESKLKQARNNITKVRDSFSSA